MYEDLSDADLLADIAEFRAAMRKAALGGGVSRVQGEGRSMSVLGADTGALDAQLRAMLAEAASRGLIASSGGAIGVEIG